MGARRLRFVALAIACAVMGVLGFGGTSAFGLETHLFQESFGPDGTSSTSFELGPTSVGVDQLTGSTYVGHAFFEPVSNVFLQNVEKFDAAHQPEPFTGISPSIVDGELTGFSTRRAPQIAVDSASHDLYVEDSTESVRAFQSDGEPADFTAGPGAGTNEIAGSEVCGVAVDSSGDIYLSEFPTGIHVFAANGESLTTIAAAGACNLAVDSHGVLYANILPGPSFKESGPVERFSPSGPPPVSSSTLYEAAGTVDETPSFSLAVDPSTDHLLVDEGSQGAEYDESGIRLGTFGSTGPGKFPSIGLGAGIAVNGATGQVYVAQGNNEGQVEVFGPAILVPDVTTEQASAIDPKGSVTLNGRVKPDGVALSECEFEYVDAEHYEPGASDPYAAGATAQCVPAAGEILVSGETQVSARTTGLTPGGTYHFRLKAGNAQGANDGADATVVLPPLPKIEAASATNLTGESADLSARVDPGSLDTTYHFEYDTSPYAPGEPEGKHGTSIGEGELAAGAGNVTVGPVQAKSLEADHTYYWRVVATNEAGTTLGVDHTFVYDTSGEGLPDDRAYEMVTSPHKNAATIPFRVLISEDGSRMITVFIQCFADAQSCTASRESIGEPYLFSRTSGGWVASSLSPPASEFAANTPSSLNVDAGTALFSVPTAPMFEDDFYVRRTDGSFVDIGPTTPPAAGPVSPSASYGTAAHLASSDFSHVVFQEARSIWFGEGGFTTFEFSGTGNTAPALVGVSGGPGSTDLISGCETTLGSGGRHLGQMSTDGEVMYFTAGTCGAGTGVNEHMSVPVGELFVRIGGGRTDAISEPQAPQIPGGPGPRSECASTECVKNTESPSSPAVNANWRSALFAGASSDGSRAFFASEQQLTDQASQDSNNLYESVCTRPCASPAQERRLLDASQGAKAHGGPGVQGVVAISADGSHVYFVARGVLDTTANAQGQAASEGANNLYVFEQDADHPSGQVRFVAQLPEADGQQWIKNDDEGYANVTPDGRFLVFESHGNLTADATRTDGAVQVFRYDAQTGLLVRISVGEHGFNNNGNAGRGGAGIVAASYGWESAGAWRSDPTMSHDGSFVFFESPIGLTRHALNDVQIAGSQSQPVYAENVYEWHEGQVYLISDGKDTAALNGNSSTVRLLGSDASGSNAFFATADQLSEQDTDTQLDAYDARICTRESPCVSQPLPSLPPCLGEACHGTPATQTGPPSAGTVAFNGQGNVSEPVAKSVKVKKGKRKRVVKCSKGRRRVRGKCVKVRAQGGKAHRSRSYKGGK